MFRIIFQHLKRTIFNLSIYFFISVPIVLLKAGSKAVACTSGNPQTGLNVEVERCTYIV